MDPEIERRIQAARRTVNAQTGLLHREFHRAPSSWKSDGSRVTAADIAISEAILRDLAAEFPGDQGFSEESRPAGSAAAVTSRFCWVLDPIDGTNNYAIGIPFCAISLALLEHGEPVYGVVYDMARRSLIEGGPGLGAFDGGQPAGVRKEPPQAGSTIGFHSPYQKEIVSQLAPIIEEFKIRGLGSSTLHLAYVGIGLLNGVLDHNVRVWDIAAAHAIALGGGAEVRFLKNTPYPLKRFDLDAPRIHYLAGNPQVCARVVELLERRGS
jgi:myo-inositol-1(or 4)-monophosphatase